MLKGRITTEIDSSGRGEVLLGGALVPRRVSVRLAGDGGEPDSEVRFEVRDGRPECISFTVTAKPDGRGVRTADLTGFNVNGMAEGAFLDWASGPDGGPVGGADEIEAWSLRGAINGAINAPGRGPSEAELKRVAEVYRQHPAGPTSAVEKLLGLSRRTASRRVQQAREAGLL